jgi:hypothetical protein
MIEKYKRIKSYAIFNLIQQNTKKMRFDNAMVVVIV